MSCVLVASDLFLHHLTGPGHPERPERSRAVVQALLSKGLFLKEEIITPKSATKEDLLLCHTASYIELVEREVAQLNGNCLAMLSTGDVVISPHSFEVACYAAGAALTAVDMVCRGSAKAAFCAVRPPGHHACSDRGMGFCLFNNVAIACRAAHKRYGIHRSLIVDWDVHHGNGTQEIFQNDPSVFYFSTHQKGIYPGTGDAADIGATGQMMNVPIVPGRSSGEDVLAAFEEKLVPAMDAFRPECVFISAGFDAHFRDPLGGLSLREEDFSRLTQIVQKIAEMHAEGRIISVLEGGYDLPALATSAVAHVTELKK